MSNSVGSDSLEQIITCTIRDKERLETLRNYQILDTASDPEFDRTARLAAHLFDAPTALVNFLDADRQWYKSTLGFEDTEAALNTSICVYALEEDAFVVEDLSEDERFADNPLVTDHGMRFYAGAPLVTPDEYRLGTLCVLDTEPQSPSAETLERLRDLAAMVVDELELRRERAEHEQTRVQLEERQQVLRKSQQLADVGGSAYDPQADAVTWTDQTYRIFGLSPEADLDLETAVDFYTPDSRSVIEPEVERLIEEGGEYDLELDMVTDDGDRRRVRTIAEAQREKGRTTQIVGAVQDITEQHRDARLNEVQKTFFESIATGTPTDEILTDIARVAEAELTGVTVSILQRDGDRLRLAAGPSLPPQFVGAVDGAKIDLEVGPCGTAAYQNEVTTTADTQEVSRWDDFQEAAEQAGFRSCSSRVIRGRDGSVLGTIATYREEPGPPTPDERGFVKTMTKVASVALERDKRDAALRRSENKFRTVVENAQPVTFMIDRDGTFLLSEGDDLAALGLEPGEVVGESVFDVYAENPSITEAVQRALDGEYVGDTVQVDGRTFNSWYSPFYDEDAVAGVIGMAVDITERKAAEEDLRRSQEQLSMAVEGGNIGTWNWDVDTDEVLFNERWAGMLGYTREELDFHFSTWEDRVHPEDLSRAMAVLEAYVEGDRATYAPEIRMRTKSGEWKWIQTIGKVIERDEDGAVTRVAGIHLDVDDRKRAEMALREAKSRYQTLVEHFPNGVVALFDDDLRYTIAGGKGLDEADLSPSNFEGSTPRDLFPAEIADPMIEYYRRALDGEKNVFEQQMDGQHYRVQTLPVQDDEGDVVAGMAVSQNITERKESRRKLKKYHDYTDRLLNAIDDFFFVLDEEGQLQRWNARVLEVTGYTETEIGGMDALNFVPTSEHERLATTIAQGFTKGSAQIKVPVLRKDGTTVLYEFVGNLVEHPDGDLQIVGIGRDITERKQRERRLQQAENFFRNAQDALFLIDVQQKTDDPTFVMQRINPSHEVQFGIPADEMCGCTPSEILGKEEAAYAEAMYRRCVDERDSIEYQETLLLDDTTTHWRTRIAPVVVDGTVEQIVGSTRDVTEQHRRKAELERQNDLFSKAQTLANVGAWEYDVQTGNGVFSSEAYRIHGLSPGAKMSTERSLQFYHPDDRPKIRNAFAQAIEAGHSYDLELRLIREDGEQRWVRTRGEPQAEDGEVVRIRGVLQDITERVRRRQELETAKEAAEKANRMKTSLLSNMNHELRTPLTSIITFSKLIRDSPDVADQFAERILNGGRRLLHTLNAVMELSELEGEGISTDPTMVRLRDIAWSVVSHFQERADEDIALEVDLSEEIRSVRLDEHLTERILTHLVHNAVKFTEEGTVTVSARTGPANVELTVTDPGIGIDPDFLPRAFDEFTQSSSGNNRAYEGNGIGLTVVDRMVQQLGGTVDIESTLGEGTTVTIRLPVD